MSWLGRSPIVVLLASLSGGCSWFTWLPWVDDGPEPEEPAKLQDFDAELTLERGWRAGIGDGLGEKYLRLPPAVVADRVVAGDAYGLVEARNRFDGERLWRMRVGEPDEDPGLWQRLKFWSSRDYGFVTGIGAGEGLILVGTTNAEVIALSVADGSEQWRTRVSSEVLSAPVAGEGRVVAQTSDGRLVALDAETGAQAWTFDTQVPVLTLRGSAEPVIASGAVFAGFANGKVGVFRAATGEPIWEQRVMLPQGRSELDRIVDVDGGLLLTPNLIFAASFQGRLKALRPQDGAAVWERDVSTHLDLAEGYGQVYLITENDVLRAYDQRTGEITWEQNGLYRRKLTSPLAFSSYLVVADGEGYVHVLAQRDGRFLGRRKIDGNGVRSRIVEAGGTLYVLGNSGRLVALDIEQYQ